MKMREEKAVDHAIGVLLNNYDLNSEEFSNPHPFKIRIDCKAEGWFGIVTIHKKLINGVYLPSEIRCANMVHYTCDAIVKARYFDRKQVNTL